MKPEEIADDMLANFSAPTGSDLREILRASLIEAARRAGESVDINLKRFLMEFGNKLVGQGFKPSGPMPASLKQALKQDHSTEPITALTTWINEHPEVVQVLEEMGIKWPM